MSAFQTVLLLSAALANSALGASPHLSISLKHGDAKERATERQLERLLSQYDLSQWVFTTSVVIDEDAIPHSHPILTLHARHLKDDDLLLSTFVHEQAHWFFDQHHEDAARVSASPPFLGFRLGFRCRQGTGWLIADASFAGRQYLVYEMYLTNFEDHTLRVDSIEATAQFSDSDHRMV